MLKNITNIKSFFIILISLSFACSNKQDNNLRDTETTKDTETEICKETAIQEAELLLKEFYNMLIDSSFDNVNELFSEERLQATSVDAVIESLKGRNRSRGVPENYELTYIEIDKSSEQAILIINAKVLNKNQDITYENFQIVMPEDVYKIQTYSYNTLPYYTLKELNDSSSVVNKFISMFFKDIYYEKYNKILEYTDAELVNNYGKDKIIESLKAHKDTVGSVVSFIVEYFSAQEIEGMIPIDLSLKVYYADKIADEVLIITDSPDRFIIQFYLPDEVPESFQRYRIRGFEELSTAINSFYDYLKQDNIGELMRMTEKSVFEVVNTDEFKFSFQSRNSHYGKPLSFVENSRSRNDVYTTIFTEVENSNGIKSYEGVTFSLLNGEYYLYGYQYSNERN